MGKIDEAWTRVVAKQARYRYVLDMTKARSSSRAGDVDNLLSLLL